MAQHSDTTYQIVKGLGYDAINKRLGLVIEEGGADAVIPFSSGYPYIGIIVVDGQIVSAVDYETMNVARRKASSGSCPYGQLTWTNADGWSITPSQTIECMQYNSADGWVSNTLQASTSYNIFSGDYGNIILVKSFG